MSEETGKRSIILEHKDRLELQKANNKIELAKKDIIAAQQKLDWAKDRFSHASEIKSAVFNLLTVKYAVGPNKKVTISDDLSRMDIEEVPSPKETEESLEEPSPEPTPITKSQMKRIKPQKRSKKKK